MRKTPLLQRSLFYLGIFLLLMGVMDRSTAQIRTTRPMVGIRERTPTVHAFVNARIVQAPGKVIPKGTLVIRDGVVEAVGKNVRIPPDARVWDVQGMTIYPGIVDPYTHVGIPKPKREARRQPSSMMAMFAQQQRETKPEGAVHRNEKVRPETDAARMFQPAEKDFKEYRKQGITAALVVPDRGIFRGYSAVVLLGSGAPNDLVIQRKVAQHLAFERGSFFGGGYPSSLMGCIALIRQTFLDADWYQKAWEAYRIRPDQPAPEENVSLAALAAAMQQAKPVVFEVEDDLNFLRAAKIYQEFGLKGWIRGSGYEYRRVELIKQTGIPVVLPVRYPETPKIQSAEDALNLSLKQLVHWEAAPENALHVYRAGIPFAFTSDGLKKVGDFLKNVREAVRRGLPADAALAALTIQPARLLGLSAQLGTLEKGKMANFILTDGDLFGKKTKIYETWVKGERFVVRKRPDVDPRGKWELTLQFPDGKSRTVSLTLSGDLEKLRGRVTFDKKRIRLSNISLEDHWLRFSLPGDSLDIRGILLFSGRVEKEKASGYAVLPDGTRAHWWAQWKEAAPPEKKRPEKEEKIEPASLRFARGAYTRNGLPPQPEYVLVKNATIWTMGPQGVLENADLLVRRGKIEKVGRDIPAPKGAVVIDATGKHVTPGLIDEHSHTAISGGVNEGTRAITCEVRILDVLNPDDIAIYRELAGGLTMCHPLHGSANPIGGQNAVIKLRWGAVDPDALVFKGFHPDVKFALGENPKRSNFQMARPRYPQTRMGVEQIIRDRFKAALDYKKAWEAYRKLKNKKGVIPPRRDLQLEALLEIVEGKRWIRCHSYRQDEILMIVRLAREFGANLRTLEHGLEAYKVADVLAENNVGVSCFSDWWAYKFEVYDAIPFNGPILNSVGVVVSYNSDSNELARRLNTEAAKAVKYGGLSKEEALKLVTINPAKQLGIDDRVGSLEPGKDADFVIWSGDPLSYFSVCEQTWIDGRKYFDREEDLKLREEVQKERNRLIQKILRSKKAGGPSGKPGMMRSRMFRPQAKEEK